jgi:predicted PurR-regulated permease PerM
VLVAALMGGAVLMAGSLAMPAAKWWERAPTTVAQLLEQWERVRVSLPLLGRPLAPTVVAPPLAPATGEARRARTPAAQAAALQKMEAAAAQQAQAQPASPDSLGSRIAAEGIALTRIVLTRFMSFGVAAAATVMLLFFLLCSEHWIVSRAVEALPRRRSRAVVLLAVRKAQRDIGHFLGTLAIINLCVGVVTGVVVWMLGMENPLLWGTLAAMLNFIPYFGPAIAVGLLGLGGVLSFDEAIPMAAPALAFLAIHFIEANVLSPWFIGRRLALSPVVVFASVMWMGWMWGVAGAMLTVPLLIGLRCGLHAARSTRRWCVMLEGSSEGVPTLSSLLKFKRRRAAAAAASRR